MSNYFECSKRIVNQYVTKGNSFFYEFFRIVNLKVERKRASFFGSSKKPQAFTPALPLIASLTKAYAENRIEERLKFYCQPKLLIID